MFMTDKEKEICKALNGLIAPCDAELNVDGSGYTLKTSTLEDLATAATFFRNAVDDKSKKLSESSVKIVVDTSMLCETMRDMRERVDEAVKNIGDHFTDGGTSKKKPVKIPNIKFGMFVSKLKQNARNRTGMYRNVQVDWRDKITYGKHVTQCTVSINATLVGVGIATKHKDDVENEYIGKSLSFNRAFDKLEKAVLGIEDEKVVGTALTMAFEDNYVNVRENGSIVRCIAGADVDIGDAVYVGHGGRVYPANSKQKGYRGGRTENSKTNAEKVVAGFDCATGEMVYMDTNSCLWKPNIKSETKSESMPNLTPIYDDITITMSRDEAEKLFKTLTTNRGNLTVFRQLLSKLR